MTEPTTNMTDEKRDLNSRTIENHEIRAVILSKTRQIWLLRDLISVMLEFYTSIDHSVSTYEVKKYPVVWLSADWESQVWQMADCTAVHGKYRRLIGREQVTWRLQRADWLLRRHVLSQVQWDCVSQSSIAIV